MPLDAAFGIRPDDYGIPCGGIIFPNPNAPTGRALSIGEVERIVAAHPEVIVIVDEAYVDFGTESALVLLPKYENLLVVQTFSKSRAMAGMRIGYAVGAEKVIKALSDVKYSFNSYTMNRTAILAGAAAAKDADWFRETCEKIVATREWAGAELARLGFRFPESKANFLFVTHPRMDAAEIFAKLRERHIYVRYFDAPRTRDYLRITIGTREQMQTLLKALEEILR